MYESLASFVARVDTLLSVLFSAGPQARKVLSRGRVGLCTYNLVFPSSHPRLWIVQSGSVFPRHFTALASWSGLLVAVTARGIHSCSTANGPKALAPSTPRPSPMLRFRPAPSRPVHFAFSAPLRQQRCAALEHNHECSDFRAALGNARRRQH